MNGNLGRERRKKKTQGIYGNWGRPSLWHSIHQALHKELPWTPGNLSLWVSPEGWLLSKIGLLQRGRGKFYTSTPLPAVYLGALVAFVSGMCTLTHRRICAQLSAQRDLRLDIRTAISVQKTVDMCSHPGSPQRALSLRA